MLFEQVSGASKEDRLKKAQSQLAAMVKKDEEDELDEVNPSEWMQHRRKTADGNTFDTYGR